MITLFIVFFLRLTVVQGTQVAMYKERRSGQCGDSGGGWGKITSTAACEAGAVVAGYLDKTAQTGSWSESPPGCFYRYGSLYFNTDNVPTRDHACSSDNKCLCTLTCPPGTYQDQSGQSSCKTCASGQYQDQSGQSSCKTCASGKYNEQVGQSSQSSCKTCASGKYNDQVGQSSESSCKTCATGQYNEQVGQPSCKTCPDGQLQFQRGQSSCDSCTSSNNTWVNSVANVQQSVEKLLGGEAKDFTVTGTLKVGTLRIRNVALQDYITSVTNSRL